MNKIITLYNFFLLMCGLLFCFYLFKMRKQEKELLPFTVWYSINRNQQQNIDIVKESRDISIVSEAMKVDTIYRSMQGPFNIHYFTFNDFEEGTFEKLFSKPKLI
jgi:hypothetical protein